VVTMAVHPGRGYEPGEALQELERGEEDFRSPVGPGLGEAIEQPGRAGRKPRLGPKELKRIERALKRGPGALGYDTELWTGPRNG